MQNPGITATTTTKRRPGRPPTYVFDRPDSELTENERRLRSAVLKRRQRQNRSYRKRKLQKEAEAARRPGNIIPSVSINHIGTMPPFTDLPQPRGFLPRLGDYSRVAINPMPEYAQRSTLDFDRSVPQYGSEQTPHQQHAFHFSAPMAHGGVENTASVRHSSLGDYSSGAGGIREETENTTAPQQAQGVAISEGLPLTFAGDNNSGYNTAVNPWVTKYADCATGGNVYDTQTASSSRHMSFAHLASVCITE